LRAGLRAILAGDRHQFHCSDPRSIAGSVNVDTALSSMYPSDPRWDYLIGMVQRQARSADLLFLWVEVHPASSHHVDEVIRKLGWLKSWIAREAPAIRGAPSRFVWLASGRVGFRAGSRQMRTIAQKGLLFRSKRLSLDSFTRR